MELYDRIVDPDLLVRRVNLTACHVIPEDSNHGAYQQLDLFSESEKMAAERAELVREKNRQKAVLKIRRKFGKNAIFKGMNLEEGATTRERNRQVGGHKAE